MKFKIITFFLLLPLIAQAETLKCEVKDMVDVGDNGKLETPDQTKLTMSGNVGDKFLFNTETAYIEGSPLIAKFFGTVPLDAQINEEKGIYYMPHTKGHVWVFRLKEVNKKIVFEHYDTWAGDFVSGSCESVL